MRQLKITKQVTNRETASLDKYLQEIGKVELITADEEVELAQRIKAGDQRALEKLTKANLRFVVSVAKQYQNQGLTLPDLINEGNLGLIKAAQRFDETRGFKFISYAVWWIRQSILQALAEQSVASAAAGGIGDRSGGVSSASKAESVNLNCVWADYVTDHYTWYIRKFLMGFIAVNEWSEAPPGTSGSFTPRVPLPPPLFGGAHKPDKIDSLDLSAARCSI